MSIFKLDNDNRVLLAAKFAGFSDDKTTWPIGFKNWVEDVLNKFEIDAENRFKEAICNDILRRKYVNNS